MLTERKAFTSPIGAACCLLLTLIDWCLIPTSGQIMTPEAKARQQIDRQLGQCGWIVQNQAEMNITAGTGVAIREFPLHTGFADYLLYAGGKVIGVVEAKPEGHTLTGVETQSAKYSDGLPAGLPHHRLPLPFAYESTGTVTQFTNNLEPDARSREVFTFHRPDELLRLVNLEEQLRGHQRHMPPLNVEGLWPLKITTLNNLETSLAANRPRSLIQMTMGSGKTLTAVIASYRLIKFADAKRILFLVDRNNLGRQTYKEFSQYVSPYNGYKFTDEYNVQHLRREPLHRIRRRSAQTHPSRPPPEVGTATACRLRSQRQRTSEELAG